VREPEDRLRGQDSAGHPSYVSRIYRGSGPGGNPLVGSGSDAHLRDAPRSAPLPRASLDVHPHNGASAYVRTIVPISAICVVIALVIAIVLAGQQWG